MNSAEKSCQERSLSLLFISFCSGFTAFHYQVVWYHWLMSHPGFNFINIHLAVIFFILGFPLGHLLGSRAWPNLNKNAMITLFIMLQVLFVVYAFCSKVIVYQWLLERHYVQPINIFEIVFALLFAMILPPILMSASNTMLSRIFESKVSSPLLSLYIYYLTGVGISILVSSLLHIQLMGVENSIYLGAFLNFSCAIIALIHFYITNVKSPKDKSRFV